MYLDGVTAVASSALSAPDRGRAPRSKLAAGVALQIVDDVARRNWPVGDVVGSEAELLERYGVSRAVLREAVRLVEHQHVARMRRGPGGGLVVTEPNIDAIIDAAIIYLLRVQAPLDEVFEARLVLEQIVTQLAPGRVQEEDLIRLRALIDDEAAGRVTDARALHALLASITRNPALELFVESLNRLANFYFSDRKALGSTAMEASGHAHQRIADAVLAGNVGLASHRMAKHLQAEADHIRARKGARQILKPSAAIKGPSGSKRAEAVARELFGELIAAKLQPGHLLGSEADLMERYGVSRAVLREAVRILEHHHIATMWRGRGGGLFVSAPSVDAVSDVVAVYLERRGSEPARLAEVRVGVDLAIVDLVIDRLDSAAVEALRAALAADAHAADEELAASGYAFHAVLAALSGNRALELIARILIRLSRVHTGPRLSKAVCCDLREQVQLAHEGVLEAVLDGDRELVRQRILRHHEAVAEHFG